MRGLSRWEGTEAAESTLWAVTLSGEINKQPKAPELWSLGPDSSSPGQRATPKPAAVSVGAGWRSFEAGMAFPAMQGWDLGLH